MRLGFDLSALQHPRGIRHGGGEYAEVVYRRLVYAKGNVELSAFFRSDWPLDDAVRELSSERGVPLHPATSFSEIRNYLREQRIDRFYSALPYHFDFGGLTAELLFSVHGLRNLELPTDFQEFRYARTGRDWLKWISKQVLTGLYVRRKRKQLATLLCGGTNSVKLFVPSEHTKYSLLHEFSWMPAEQISVFYAPKTTNFVAKPENTEFLNHHGLKLGEYILLVSGDRWEKNSYRAVRAVAAMIRKQPLFRDFRIVLTGGAPERVGRNIRAVMTVFEYVSRERLAALYENAFCLLYPTLNEGFGYPPLEAMCRRTPVVCAAVTSVTEIVGDACLYFDPHFPNEICTRLLRLKSDPLLRQELISRGAERSTSVADRQEMDLERIVNSILG